MIREPKIRGKDSTGEKSTWLHDAYTHDARAFYMTEHSLAQGALNNAAQQSEDPNVVRHFERLMAIEEILALLTYNEQNRDDDD